MIKGFSNWINKINTWVGNWMALIVLTPLLVLVTMEVILRYGFNRPTIWAWDVNIQLLGAMVALGGGYALQRGRHVAIDVIIVRLSRRARVKAILQLLSGLLVALSVAMLLWNTVPEVYSSLMIKEVYNSYFAPPIYPLKLLMAIGFFLLLLQAIANFISDIYSAIKAWGESKS